VEEAVRDAELRAREQAGQLRAELEAVRAESERSLADVQRRGQEEIERLRREVQAARDAEQRAREESQRRDLELTTLRGDLEQQQEGTSRSAEQLRKLEQRAQDMEEELRRERALARQRGSAVTEQRRSFEVQLSTVTGETEDLRRQLREVTVQRDGLDSDMNHLKNANSQREDECKQLRSSITQEKQTVKLLQAELQTRQAEVTAVGARAQFETDTMITRTSVNGSRDVSPSPRNTGGFERNFRDSFKETSTRSSAQTQMIDVDLTDDQGASPSRLSNVGGRNSDFRRSPAQRSFGDGAAYGTRVMETITVDVTEDETGSEIYDSTR